MFVLPAKIIHRQAFSVNEGYIWDKPMLICDEICNIALSRLSVILFKFAAFCVIAQTANCRAKVQKQLWIYTLSKS